MEIAVHDGDEVSNETTIPDLNGFRGNHGNVVGESAVLADPNGSIWRTRLQHDAAVSKAICAGPPKHGASPKLDKSFAIAAQGHS